MRLSERVHAELSCYLQNLISSKDMIRNFSADTWRTLLQVRQTCSLQLQHMHLLGRSYKLQSQKKLLIWGIKAWLCCANEQSLFKASKPEEGDPGAEWKHKEASGRSMITFSSESRYSHTKAATVYSAKQLKCELPLKVMRKLMSWRWNSYNPAFPTPWLSSVLSRGSHKLQEVGEANWVAKSNWQDWEWGFDWGHPGAAKFDLLLPFSCTLLIYSV